MLDNEACLLRLRLVLRPGGEARLRALTRSSTAAAGVVRRARIVPMAADGVANAAIGRQVGVSTPTVLAWRNGYDVGGIGALGDLPRSGRPAVIDEAAVVTATLNSPPTDLSVTHWSARLGLFQLGSAVMRSVGADRWRA